MFAREDDSETISERLHHDTFAAALMAAGIIEFKEI